MKRFFIGWNVIRVVQLLVGLAALVQGFVQKEVLVLAAGSWLLFGALFNLGWCSSSGCYVTTPTQKQTGSLLMKRQVLQNKGYITGAVLGGLAGFLYWKYVGCLTGTCAISFKPLNSTLYFALLGSFRKTGLEKTNAADE